MSFHTSVEHDQPTSWAAVGRPVDDLISHSQARPSTPPDRQMSPSANAFPAGSHTSAGPFRAGRVPSRYDLMAAASVPGYSPNLVSRLALSHENSLRNSCFRGSAQ